jgi:hypothetical protein
MAGTSVGSGQMEAAESAGPFRAKMFHKLSPTRKILMYVCVEQVKTSRFMFTHRVPFLIGGMR